MPKVKPKAKAKPANSLSIEYRSIDSLQLYAKNSRTHSADQIAQIAASIAEFGFTNPVLIDESSRVIAGHGRILAAQQLGVSDVPTITLAGLTDAQRRAYVIADNKLALNAGWDIGNLISEISDLKIDGFDISLVGFSMDELAAMEPPEGGASTAPGSCKKLADDFIYPPFSVINARAGDWQARKKYWSEYIGLESSQGREKDLIMSSPSSHPEFYIQKNKKEAKLGRKISTSEFADKYWVKPAGVYGNGTSIFDPALAEILVSWFCPRSGVIIDPFAGGVVRGAVSAILGRQYVGVDIRPEQITANNDQWGAIADALDESIDAPTPTWVVGDSMNINSLCDGVKADMILTCPPYGDLEEYSDIEGDISMLGYDEFRIAYSEIINRTCLHLSDNSFAACVVGEIRGGKNGVYNNFISHTIQSFKDAGVDYYNEIILVTSVGSAAMRATKQFNSGRKVCKTHQNVLVFIKGDPKIATERCGTVNVADIPEEGW